MRPIKLEVQNIASFHGRHCIDFDQTGGLFAITGATGAGKSSLLNSICLALYGRGPKKSLFAQDYLTQGQDNGHIIFHFSHQAKIYQAHWRIDRRTTRQGKPAVTVKRLFYCDNQAMRAGAESVLGMSFDQFCRTVILNQGDFAKFINSSFSERRDIIERLAQAKELQYLHQQLSQELKAHEIELQHYREKSQWYVEARDYDRQLGEQIIEQLAHVRDSAQIILEGLQQSLNAIQRCKEHILQLAQNQTKVDQTKEMLNQLLKELIPVREAQIKSQQELQHFESDWAPKQSMLQEAIGVTTQLEALAEQIERTTKQQHQLSLQLKENSDQLQLQSQQMSLHSSESTRLQETWGLNELIQWDFESIQQNILKLQALQKLIKQYKYEAQIAQDESVVLKEKINSIELEISKLPVASFNLEQQESELAAAEKVLIQKREQHAAQLHWANLLQESYKNIIALINQLPEINSKIELKGKDLTIAKRDLQVHQLQHSLKQIAQLSKESGQCLVCHHAIDEKKDLSSLEPQDQVSTHHKMLEQSLEASEQAYHQLKSQRDSILALMLREQERFQSICQTLALPFDLLPPESLLEQQDNMLAPVKISIQQHEEMWGKLVVDEDAIKLFRQQTQTNKNFKQQYDHLKAQAQLWQQQWQRSEQEQIKKSALAQEQASEFNLLAENIMALNIPLNQFAKNKLSAPNLQDSEILLQLSDEWNHWRHGATQWRQLQQTIQALKTAQTQTRHNGTLLQQNYDVNSHELLKLSERQLITRNLLQTLSPNGNPKAEWQMLQERQLKLKSVADHDKDKLTALESKRERFKTTLSMLNEQVQSIEQMAIHYHATFENCYVELQTKTQTLAQEIVLLQKYWPAKMQAYNMPALSNKMPSLQQSDNGQHDFEQTILGLEIFINHYLSPQLNWIKTFYEFCQAQSHGLKSEHQRQIQLQQEWQVMLKAMEKMQHRYNSLRDLDHIIGKNDFRNWALAKIEEELINLANRELQQMCQGRYQLVQEIGKNGPEFLIEDLWSCSPPRKVSSLSGGETFLVSLAMAMALADMVRGQTYLESFFIDEGFGQLDPDGLEEAMSALWSIGQRGKTIGVISHIADLTNRIPVNIHVEKGARGHAHIEMIYH